MMHTFTAQPRPVAAALTRLADLGVTLPDRLTDAAVLLEDAANGNLVRQAQQPAELDLLALSRDELVSEIRNRAALASVHDGLGDHVWHVALKVAASAAALVREHADDIIEQMAPAFAKAAEAVHAAAKAGLNPWMTPADVLALGNPQAAGAWRTVSLHVDTLGAIADARIAMTDACDVAPSPDSFGPRQYGACFSPDAPLYERQDGRAESPLDRWLRLCGHAPARLLDTATTERAARQWRATPPPPSVPPDYDDTSTPSAAAFL